MAYSAKAVANHFLDLAEENGVSLSPMKLQKLVYYAHGWYLGINGEPLINEQVECWPYGPVIDSLFHEFKIYGSGQIATAATKRKIVRVKDGPITKRRLKRVTPRIPQDHSETRQFLDTIWDAYGHIPAIKLSNMTHEKDGPWYRTFEEYDGHPPHGTDIPQQEIQKYFEALVDDEG